ncbi:MAG: multidrug efflux SMR transporter [Pyrinomonadaceae bacterium]|nr:multidrug efflux SMR transporter [Phycisphaerales bacterium]
MTYLFLALAIIFEVAWAIGIKVNSNFTPPIKWGSLAATLIAYVLSLVFLMLTVRKMNISTAYAIWAGTGAAIIALIGIYHFSEPRSTLKIVSLLLVVLGVIGLNLSEHHAPAQQAPVSKE